VGGSACLRALRGGCLSPGPAGIAGALVHLLNALPASDPELLIPVSGPGLCLNPLVPSSVLMLPEQACPLAPVTTSVLGVAQCAAVTVSPLTLCSNRPLMLSMCCHVSPFAGSEGYWELLRGDVERISLALAQGQGSGAPPGVPQVLQGLLPCLASAHTGLQTVRNDVPCERPV